MSSGPPESAEIVDAVILAARDAKVSQRFKVAGLPRLAELTATPDSEADLQARFHWVDGRCSIEGRVTGSLRTTCQRCLRPAIIAIEDEFQVLLVNSEEEMELVPEEQDSLIADPTHLDLAWLTEEQLLLAMPLVPLHPDGECEIRKPEAQAAESKQTPFANLRELLNKS